MDTSFPEKTENFPQEQEILSVTRGVRLEEKSIEKRIRELLYKEKPLNELLRKIKSSKGNYSGTFYSNYFRVDTPIRLVDIGFFGPSEVEFGSYFVHIEIFRPHYTKKKRGAEVFPTSYSGKRLTKTRRFMTVAKETTFFVEPCKSGSGLEIAPGVWHLIQFMLEGPNTLRCEKTFGSAKVDLGNGRHVNFDFDVGSMQMPQLRFTSR